MRHSKHNRKFGRERKGRKALLRSLAEALITHGAITTTEAKAKELRPYLEKLVTKGKVDSPANDRLVTRRLLNRTATAKLFQTFGPQFKSRAGGYTRITKLPRRLSDGSRMARIEFVS